MIQLDMHACISLPSCIHFSTHAGDSSCSCLTGFDIFAQTSGVTYAESPGGTHDVEILLANGEKKTLELTEFPPKNAAKLFSFDLPDNTQCVSIFDIAKITVVAKSTEGWNIETIVTIFADNKGRTYSGSIDRKVNRWVDHNDKPEYESFVLNLSSHG